MKKPNPHFMDRKVTYKRNEKKSFKNKQKQEAKNGKQNDNDADQKPRHKPSRKQRIMQKRKQKIQILKQRKKQVVQQLGVAQTSTKSMGKFDRKAHQQERKLKIKGRKNHASFKNLDQQIQRNMQVLSMVKRSEGSKKVNHSM